MQDRLRQNASRGCDSGVQACLCGSAADPSAQPVRTAHGHQADARVRRELGIMKAGGCCQRHCHNTLLRSGRRYPESPGRMSRQVTTEMQNGVEVEEVAAVRRHQTPLCGQRCGSDRAEGERMSESQFPHMLLLERMQVLSRSIIIVVISYNPPSSLACAAARFRYGGGDDSQPRCAARYAWASTAAPSTRPPARPPRRSEDRSPRQQQLEVPLNPPTPGSRPPSCVHRADSQQPAQAHPPTPPPGLKEHMDCSQKASPPGANCIPFRRLGNGFCTPAKWHSLLSTAATHEPLPAKVDSLACLLAARRFPQRRRGFCLARTIASPRVKPASQRSAHEPQRQARPDLVRLVEDTPAHPPGCVTAYVRRPSRKIRLHGILGNTKPAWRLMAFVPGRLARAANRRSLDSRVGLLPVLKRPCARRRRRPCPFIVHRQRERPAFARGAAAAVAATAAAAGGCAPGAMPLCPA
ncbi:hypothetical protein ACCO45_008442 [Purpureocillium lilacinum]|uniref:Uncharacterized protein n=1 Tax=Purpureocillium lilacinum TaxID=33203 RepID=A0ACC4DPR7_PURLI